MGITISFYPSAAHINRFYGDVSLSSDLTPVTFYTETHLFARNANGAHYPQRSASDYDDTREKGGADVTIGGGVSGGVGGVVWGCFVGYLRRFSLLCSGLLRGP